MTEKGTTYQTGPAGLFASHARTEATRRGLEQRRAAIVGELARSKYTITDERYQELCAELAEVLHKLETL